MTMPFLIWFLLTLAPYVTIAYVQGDPCLPFCTTCSGVSCTSCEPGYTLDPVHQVCQHPSCPTDNDLYLTTGLIQLLNSSYVNNMVCYWFIQAPTGSTITVKFTDTSIHCGDYVTVHDGPTSNATLLASVCGQNSPSVTGQQLHSTTNYMTLQLVTDSAVTMLGFNATVTFTNPLQGTGDCAADPCPSGYSCTQNITSYNCMCPSGYTGSVCTIPCSSNCISCEPSTNGTRCTQCITTPDALGMYYGLDTNYICSHCSNNCHNCKEAGSGFCDPNSCNTPLAYHPTDRNCVACPASCASCTVEDTSVAGNSSSSATCSSCVGGYRQDNSAVCEPVTPACMGEVSLSLDGEVSVALDPTGYANDMYCAWVITSSPDTKIIVNFTFIDIEGGPNCEFDRISLYDGPTSNSTLLSSLCGASANTSTSSTSNVIYMVFVSDFSATGQGYLVNFTSQTKVIPIDCNVCQGMKSSSREQRQNYTDIVYNSEHWSDSNCSRVASGNESMKCYGACWNFWKNNNNSYQYMRGCYSKESCKQNTLQTCDYFNDTMVCYSCCQTDLCNTYINGLKLNGAHSSYKIVPSLISFMIFVYIHIFLII